MDDDFFASQSELGLVPDDAGKEENLEGEYLVDASTASEFEDEQELVVDEELEGEDEFEDQIQGYLARSEVGEGDEDEWYEGIDVVGVISVEDPRMERMRKMTIHVPDVLAAKRRLEGEDPTRISGDFEPIPEGRDPHRAPSDFMKVSLLSEDFELEADIEEMPIIEGQAVEGKLLEIDTKLQRMQKCKDLFERWISAKVKNSILERQCVTVFQKCRYALKETGGEPDELDKYHEKLLLLYKNNLKYKYIQSIKNNEVELLQKKRDIKEAQVAGVFDDFQKREKEVADGMTYRSTGKKLTESRIVWLLARQKKQFLSLCDMRLEYYLENAKVASKEKDLSELDTVSSGLNLADLEIMKLENCNYNDRIEEKEDELIRLRSKCRHVGQIIAHVREKSSGLVNDIIDMEEFYWRLVEEGTYLRHTLNEIKQERDFFRQQLHKLKSESGLLFENALLRDMEKSLKDVKVVRAQLKDLQDRYALHNKHLRNLRKYRETICRGNYPRESKPKKAALKKIAKATASQLYTVEIPLESYDHVKNMSPGVKQLSK